MAEVETSAHAETAWPGLGVAEWTPRSLGLQRKVSRTPKLQVNVNQNDPLAAMLGDKNQLMA